uniref:Ig-like domain-containing protein n=1 Tax=Periophthalmus magnuspinnatus TaxID=409849 RepID=A0A3B3Z7W2_9GOBI
QLVVQMDPSLNWECIGYIPYCLFTGCTSGPVFETKTSDVGQTVTLRCPRVPSESNTYLYWIRLLSGNVPESLGGTPGYDDNSHGPLHSSIKTKQEPGSFILSIERPQLSDTGLYYCVRVQNLIKTMSPDLSGPVDSGDSVDLQCWVQMENAQCFEEHMVWWFRSGLDQSGPGLVYTQRNSSAQCDRSTEDPGPHKCLYTFSKTMSPSDAETYRCAVAACGHILFGNGTNVYKKENSNLHTANIALILLSTVLGLIVIITPICLTMKKLNKPNQGHDQQKLQVPKYI